MYFLVPRDVAATEADLWMAVAGEEPAPGVVRLNLPPNAVADDPPWRSWSADGTARLHYRTVRVGGLAPRRSYPFRLEAEGTARAAASLTTLPEMLPTSAEKPFTVLLGSCFSQLEDKTGRVGTTYLRMPRDRAPDVKFLAGDQVYLDSPWYRYLRPHGRRELAGAFLAHYLATWGQAGGFADLLARGANYFTSDDHEFWNNAPNFVAFASNTFTRGQRDVWWELANGLYSVFQTERSLTRFDVPPLSFMIADTRRNRSGNRSTFMTDSDLAQLAAWVEGLKGPGVLVLGQPVLQTATGFLKGTFGDWNLPDFAQYDALVQILGRSPRSLTVLTGDVHFGRIAFTTPRLGGQKLVEIISSPLSLVDKAAEGEWIHAPEHLAAARRHLRTAPLAPIKVATLQDFNPTAGHFLTLEFTRRGAGAHLGIRYWPILQDGLAPPDFGARVWETILT